MKTDAKKQSGIEGKDVEVFLKTPLFRFRYRVGKVERELLENAVRISGSIVTERPGGLVLEVSEISNMKQEESDLPFETIFLPFAKIDFVILG